MFLDTFIKPVITTTHLLSNLKIMMIIRIDEEGGSLVLPRDDNEPFSTFVSNSLLEFVSVPTSS